MTVGHNRDPCSNAGISRGTIWIVDAGCIRRGPDFHGKGKFWGDDVRISLCASEWPSHAVDQHSDWPTTHPSKIHPLQYNQFNNCVISCSYNAFP